MQRYLRSLLAALLLLPGLFCTTAQAAPNQWNGSGPFATGLGNRVIHALAVSPDGKTVYAGTGSGTVFSYALAPSLSAVGVSGTTQMVTTLSATSDKAATGYWIVVARGATAPTSAGVKAATSYSGVTLVASGSGTMTASVAKTFAVAGLAGSTDYDLYVMAEDAGGNQSAPPALVPFSTLLNSYAITAAASPVAGGSVSCTPNPVNQGSTSTCSATANVGYTFTGFSGACSGVTCSLANVTSAKSVTANFTLNTYAITATASPAAGGSVSCTPNPVSFGGTSTCTATANAGYTFSAFSGDCTSAACTLSNVTSAKSVTASFTQTTYAITTAVSPSGAGTVSCTPNPVNHGSGSTCTASASANGGYTFSAFSGDCTGATCVLSNVTSAKSVTATFAPITHTITTAVSPAGSGTVSCTVNPVGHDSSTVCTATPNPGYGFTVWSGDCDGAACALSNVTTAKSVTANFSSTTYTITASVSPAGAGTVSCTANPVGHDGSSICTATPNAGYGLTLWSGDCAGATCELNNVTAAKAVTANFSNTTYSITTTASPAGGGTVSCTANPVGHAGSSVCTVTPNAGYAFVAFGGDCTGAICVLSNVTAAKAVTANFSTTAHAITPTVSPVGSGTISCTANPVGDGGSSTCTATPKAGYTFSAFSGDCTGATCALANVTSAKSVTANFSSNTYAITTITSPTGGGMVSCTANPVTHDGGSTCTTTVNAGYTLTAWSGDCTGATCVLSNVTSAKSVTASFSGNTYAITTSASPAAGGSVSCSPNPVTHGSNAACTATANAGYTFGSFSGDCTGTICTLSNVTSTKSVTASFTLITSYSAPAPGGGTIQTRLSGSATCGFANVGYQSAAGAGGTPPAGYTFPHGVLVFASNANCATGVTVTLTYPSALPAGTKFFKYGPASAGASPTWYEHPATISSDRLTVTYRVGDNGPGDNNPAAGVITDPGGPGVPGGGGSGVASVPTLSEWALLLLASLLAGVGLVGLRIPAKRSNCLAKY